MYNKKSLLEIIATRDQSINFSALAGFLPDPDHVIRKKGKGISILKDLSTDPHIWACMQSRKSGITSMEWDINRGKTKSNQAKTIAKIFQDLDIYKIISEILDAPFWGYQPLEIIWQKSGNLILPVDIIGKPPEWFAFDSENKLRFISKTNRQNGQIIPEYKFLCPQYNPSYNNPYGERVLSRCFWPATFKKGGLKFWVTFTEKYGMPFLIGKHPRQSDSDATEELAEKLENMVQDAIAVIPDDSSVEIQEAGGKGASADIYEKLIQHCNQEISKAILGQTLTTEVGDKGSYAASKTHQDVRKDIIDADKRLVKKTLNQLVFWICELNFSSGDLPYFDLWQEEDVDKALAERDQILTNTGVKFSKSYYQKAYGLEDDDFEISSDTQNSQKQNFSEQVSPVALFSRHPEQSEGSNNDPQQQLDQAINAFTPELLQKQINPILKPLISKLKKAESYEQMMEIIATAYPDMDDKKFQETLARAIFISEIFGRLNGKD